MIISGKVRGGVVVLEGSSQLPEGAAVTVSYQESTPGAPRIAKKRIDVPLIRGGQPGSLHLTGEQIGAILDEEDAAPRH